MSKESALILHCGAREVTAEELKTVEVPPSEGRWYPLEHSTVLTRVKDTLGEAGFEIDRERLALSKGDARFFGVLDLRSILSNGVTLSVGVRNSHDRSFPIGFCAGSRVFCCDNLAFQSELMVKRRHTRHGERRFGNDIAQAVVKLNQFKSDETRRIAVMKETEITDQVADSLILRAFEKGIINTVSLPTVIKEWREPSFDEFRDRVYWSLYNAFTTVLGDKAKCNPHQYAATTMRLSSHLVPTAAS